MAAVRRRRSPAQQPLEHRLLLTATFCLLAGGAVMVYSASSARTLLEGQGNGTTYLIKYVAYGAVGLLFMHLLSRGGLDLVRRLTPVLLLGSFAMLVLVLILPSVASASSRFSFPRSTPPSRNFLIRDSPL